MDEIQNGVIEHTTITDENGSTVTVIDKLRDGITQYPRRTRFEIRHRTDKTDLQKIADIAQTLVNDFSKLDAEIKLEKTKGGELQGYYTIVECYTVLEY